MWKSVLVLFAFLLIPLFANSQCTKDKYSGLSFPDSFDSWSRGEIKDLEEKYPGYGTLTDYDLDKLHVTLYLYSAGLSSVDVSDVENDYKDFCTEINNLVPKGIYSDVVSPKKDSDLIVNDDIKVINAFFKYTYKGTAYGSFYFNTAMNNIFVKVRFSMPVSLLEEKKSTVNDFVKELYKRIADCK